MIFLSCKGNHLPYKMRLLLLLLTCFSLLKSTTAEETAVPKILLITVNETGIITVGRDTVNADNLARYLQERLFKSYMGTGKMQDQIKLVRINEAVPEMVTEVVMKEIQEGQRRALVELSLQKYRKTFDSLDRKKQSRLKKQFPVLFQSTFI
jgi:hypothetical protein